MKTYDYKKVKEFILKNANIIESASLGLNEDWFWTANDIYSNGVFDVDLDDENLLIAGLKGSFWATPTLEVFYFDGDSEKIEVSVGSHDLDQIELIEKQIAFTYTLGCLSQPLQENRGDIDRKI